MPTPFSDVELLAAALDAETLSDKSLNTLMKLFVFRLRDEMVRLRDKDPDGALLVGSAALVMTAFLKRMPEPVERDEATLIEEAQHHAADS